MIVAGFGFRGAATEASLQNAYEQAGRAQALATVADKAEHPAFVALAARLHLPVIKVNPDKIPEQNTATHSQISQKTKGTGSLSEAAALAAAGPKAQLLAPRSVSTDRLATCALARSAPTGAPK